MNNLRIDETFLTKFFKFQNHFVQTECFKTNKVFFANFFYFFSFKYCMRAYISESRCCQVQMSTKMTNTNYLIFYGLPPFFRRILRQQQSNKLLSRKGDINGVNKIVYQRLIWCRYSKFCLIDKTSRFKLCWKPKGTKYRWVYEATDHYSWFKLKCI